MSEFLQVMAAMPHDAATCFFRFQAVCQKSIVKIVLLLKKEAISNKAARNLKPFKGSVPLEAPLNNGKKREGGGLICFRCHLIMFLFQRGPLFRIQSVIWINFKGGKATTQLQQKQQRQRQRKRQLSRLV